MNIIVFGATGGTGRKIVEYALNQGHAVTAFSRTADLEGAKNIQGDANSYDEVYEAVMGHDAVLSCLGGNASICSQGTKNIVRAMKVHGIKRLIIESAYGVFDTKKGLYARFLWLVIPARLRDKEHMEKIVRASHLDWVIVRPVNLTDGPKTSYEINKPEGIWPTVSRANVAHFMLRQIDNDAHLHKEVVL